MWSFAHLHLALVVTILGWMTSLVPDTVRCRWRDRFPELADAIAYAAEASDKDTLTRAADLTSVAFHESSFDPSAIGDGGLAIGAFQVHPFSDVKKDALLDPRTAAVVSERLLSKSERICALPQPSETWEQGGRPTLTVTPPAERWAWYASGDPTCARGRDKARSRYALARSLERRARTETR